MIKLEEHMNIQALSKRGYSTRAIARMTGLHRKTIKKYLEQKALPVYKAINRENKIDPYKYLIEGWIEREKFQASRIYDLLLLQGFKGSERTVRRYMQQIKQKRDQVAYIRFETMPGQQAQVDFGDFVIENADGKKKTIYCFIMVLGFSRKMYVCFIERCTMENFLRSHQQAFKFFGGMPSEIVYDNMKNVVIKRLVGKVEWNKTFLSFCVHYGFKPLVTPVYSPWAKGKVERPIQYIRERFWRGYIYHDLSETNKDILQWIRVTADRRNHGTTKEIVADHFKQEQIFLNPLPINSYDISEKYVRQVYKDCQISFNGNKYVVPHEYVGKRVLVKLMDDCLRIFHNEKQIARYSVPKEKGRMLGHPEFYEQLMKDKEQLRRKYRRPLTKKARATRGLIKQKLRIEVENRPLTEYDQAVREVSHVTNN